MFDCDDIRKLSHRSAVGDVDTMSRHAHSVSSRKVCGPCHSNLVYVGKREVTAATRERYGDRATDAARRSRDHSRSPVEAHALRHGSSLPLRALFELHRAVFNAPISHHRKVFHVILVQAPGRLQSLSRKSVQRAQDVSGVEIDHRLFSDVRIFHSRRADDIAVMVHVVQESAHISCREVTFQSPRCVRVADGEGKVGYVAEHHSFVDEGLRKIHGRVVDYHLHPAE